MTDGYERTATVGVLAAAAERHCESVSGESLAPIAECGDEATNY